MEHMNHSFLCKFLINCQVQNFKVLKWSIKRLKIKFRNTNVLKIIILIVFSNFKRDIFIYLDFTTKFLKDI